MRKVILFLFVGASSALIDVGSLYILNKVIIVDKVVSITIAFLLGLIFNYFCHTYITFSNSANSKNLIKYLIVVVINYLVTISLVQLMQMINFDIIAAKIITLPIVAVITFLLSSKWVYK